MYQAENNNANEYKIVMMFAADDGQGGVKLVTIDGDIASGSQVR